MKKNPISRQPVTGFTMIEMMIAIMIIGLLSAIAVPSWLQMIERQRLSAAQDKALLVMREAQANAKRESRVWQICFRDNTNQVLWAIQSVPANSNRNCTQAGNWQPLNGDDSKSITINQTYTNLTQTPASSGYYGVQYTLNGWLVNDGGTIPRKITFTPRMGNNGLKRCVIVSSLLGAIRSDKDTNCN